MPLLVTLLAVAMRAPVLHVPGALAQVSTHTHGHSSCSMLAVKQGGAVIGTTSLTGVKGSTPAACCAACDANPRCIAFTLSVTSDTEKECWLKDNIKNGTTCLHPTCISGTNGRKPLPPPPQCANFSTDSSCPRSRCTWANGRCGSPPPPPPPPGPCSTASEADCYCGRAVQREQGVLCSGLCLEW